MKHNYRRVIQFGKYELRVYQGSSVRNFSPENILRMYDKLQIKFNQSVKWVFHYFGFLIEKVPDENQLYSELKHTHEAVQKYVLKRLTTNIRIANNHKLYNSLLKRYVPSFDCDFTTATFIGNGIGEFSFDTFRKVYFHGNFYFEKVYFNDTCDLLKIQWLHEHLAFLLNDSLNVPRIYRILKGDLITIVYFEFSELVQLPYSKLEAVSFKVSQSLIEISKTSLVEELVESAPKYLKDYTLHAFYKGNIGRASSLIKMLSNNTLSSDLIRQVVDQQPLVLTHGDIQETNVFANNYLIDWDSFGFFPLGFESAYILYQSDYRKGEGVLSSKDLHEILLENYKTIANKNQWIGFELTCFYFYFVFISLHENASPTTQQKDVFTMLEQLYREARQDLRKRMN